MWQDPGGDVKLETPEPGTLQLTVPDGNDFWDARSDAPRLLHKVTGDFDLEAETRLDLAGTDLASLEFLLYSPGSAVGALAKQMRADGVIANYRIIGGGWLRSAGMNAEQAGPVQQTWQDGVDAPAEGPVRLRLTRRGDLWKTYWSTDGQNWNPVLARRACRAGHGLGGLAREAHGLRRAEGRAGPRHPARRPPGHRAARRAARSGLGRRLDGRQGDRGG